MKGRGRKGGEEDGATAGGLVSMVEEGMSRPAPFPHCRFEIL